MKPERIGPDVKRELGRFGPVAGMAELVAAWPELVGGEIAQNAWPARFGRDGTLHVATSSSAWAFELSQLAPEIIGRMGNRLADAPRALRFAPGKLPEPDSDVSKGTAAAPVEPGAEHVEMGRALASSIEDENLREVVAKTAAKSLARAADDRSVW